MDMNPDCIRQMHIIVASARSAYRGRTLACWATSKGKLMAMHLLTL